MVTKEEAIKMIENDIRIHHDYLSGKYRQALTMAVVALKERPKWIPCSEQLPSEKGEYLVTYHPCYHDIVEPEVKVGLDTFRGKTSWAKKKYQKVIAWKPLPMAWEGEEDEADKSQSE